MDWKTEINFKENIIKMEINTTKIRVHFKEFKHWKSVSIIKRYGEKPVVDDKSNHHGIDDTPEINIGTELNNEQQNQIQRLVYEYRDVFRTEPGRAKFYEHQLTLTENASFVRRTYPIPLHYNEEVEKEVQQMLANGVIERASSPYINPLVEVTMPHGSKLMYFQIINFFYTKRGYI
jgi:phosphotransferase system IIB component